MVSFAVGNQSNSRYASIYRYLGNADGSLPAQSTWTELELCLPKGTYGNGQCVAYQINISEEEVAAGYEFVIGRSSKNAANTAGFFYLYLAGTDKNSGTSDGKGGIALIDYAHYGADGVTLFPKFADIASPEGYKPLNTCLVFGGTTSSDAYVLCNAKDGSDASTTVYYSSSGIAVSEQITASPASSFTSDSSLFPPRLVN